MPSVVSVLPLLQVFGNSSSCSFWSQGVLRRLPTLLEHNGLDGICEVLSRTDFELRAWGFQAIHACSWLARIRAVIEFLIRGTFYPLHVVTSNRANFKFFSFLFGTLQNVLAFFLCFRCSSSVQSGELRYFSNHPCHP